MTIANFLTANYHPNPAGRIKVREAHQQYLNMLPERERRLCPRWKSVAEVAEHYPVGRDSDQVLCIGGLGSHPPEAWTVDPDGRLRLQSTI